ncbi:hypothetical protein ANCDUO_20665, partial [Ancylostoma duodenale]
FQRCQNPTSAPLPLHSCHDSSEKERKRLRTRQKGKEDQSAPYFPVRFTDSRQQLQWRIREYVYIFQGPPYFQVPLTGSRKQLRHG